MRHTEDCRANDRRVPKSLRADYVNPQHPESAHQSEAFRVRTELEELVEMAENVASLVAERLAHVSRARNPEECGTVLSEVKFDYSSPYFDSLHNRIIAVNRMLHNIRDSIYLTEV